MAIRWLFFDVGYTLINEDQVWQKRFEEQALLPETAALGLTPADIRREVERSSMERKPQYRSFLQRYALTQAAPYRHELEVPYPEAHTVLTVLSKRYQLGAIANQADGLAERLAHWNLLSCFSLLISSWDYQVMKPDKRLFEIALEKAKCSAQEAVMIGDRLDNDIAPAKALGMRTIWIQQGFGALQHPLSPADTPDYTIGSLRDLADLF